jgi:succinate dehydrogenase/fumarate reductase flavoprotein subunit
MMDFLVRQQGDRVFAICDRATLESATAAGVARYKQMIPGSSKRQSPHWTTDIVDQMVSDGRVHTADSLDALALQLGISAKHLVGTVDRYNRGVACGDDGEFAKDPKFLEPVAVAPFYGVEMRPATVCFTAYGLRTDRDARVLDNASNPIDGLFAAGECTGGVVGAQYVGSGNSYANITVFGRIAGESAAALAQTK